MFPDQLCHICTFWGINMLDVPFKYLNFEGEQVHLSPGMLAGFHLLLRLFVSFT